MKVDLIHTTFGIIDNFEWDEKSGKAIRVLEANTADDVITVEFYQGHQKNSECPSQELCGFLIIRERKHVVETAMMVGERFVAVAKFNELLAESMQTNKEWTMMREALGDFL